MRFLVVQLSNVTQVGSEDVDGQVDLLIETDSQVHICEDTRAVARKIQNISEKGDDWNLFEVVRGRALKRAVVLKRDGAAVYDCEVE